MNAKQFFYKVVEMRSAQKDYFNTRSHTALSKSRALEREIDEEISRVNDVLEGKPKPIQGELFS